MSSSGFNIFSFTGKMKVLHMTWVAFFLTFLVWFNLAPLLGQIQQSLGLDRSQITTLLILNVALTIPARPTRAAPRLFRFAHHLRHPLLRLRRSG